MIVVAAALAVAAALVVVVPDRTGLGDDEVAIYGAALRTFVTSELDAATRVYAIASIDGEPIPPAARRVLAGGRGITFIAYEADVLDRAGGCPRVRGGGVVITIGRLAATGRNRVEVPIRGYRACLGATSLTYVVGWVSGAWRVTGDTGVRGSA